MKFTCTILADPSLVIIALYLICLISALVQTRTGEETLHVHYMTMFQSREEGFLRNTSILHFLPQIYLPLGGEP